MLSVACSSSRVQESTVVQEHMRVCVYVCAFGRRRVCVFVCMRMCVDLFVRDSARVQLFLSLCVFCIYYVPNLPSEYCKNLCSFAHETKCISTCATYREHVNFKLY